MIKTCSFLILGLVMTAAAARGLLPFADAGEGCVACHGDRREGFAPGHDFGRQRCSVCHRGDPMAVDEEGAHRGVVAFPGNLSNAAQICAPCHDDKVTNVAHGMMRTGRGMVQVTRRVLGETSVGPADLSLLGESPADSLLRKLCASCHLGHEKKKHALDPLKDRGGGCLACHVNDYPENAHTALTARVSDDRCFGCHSRSARLALGYVGLAEVNRDDLNGEDPQSLVELGDGRLVAREADDVHHRAGMSCIDCHTARGLMGWAKDPAYQEQAVDIACSDCHDNRGDRMRLQDWPSDLRGRVRAVPFKFEPHQPFLTTQRFGTPLWNVQTLLDPESGKEAFFLHPKNGGQRLRIPQLSAKSHALADEHPRLSCEACHTQWAPQCYGCHLRYSEKGRQWDHMQRRGTPGRWHQKRWDIRRDLPTLGVTAEDKVSPFIPGMILTMEHPDWDGPMFRRFFAATSPHTVGKSRSCVSCHRSSLALGLGRGRLTRSAGAWSFEPASESAQDGLPADAWTSLKAVRTGRGTRPGERSLTQAEMERILSAPVSAW